MNCSSEWRADLDKLISCSSAFTGVQWQRNMEIHFGALFPCRISASEFKSKLWTVDQWLAGIAGTSSAPQPWSKFAELWEHSRLWLHIGTRRDEGSFIIPVFAGRHLNRILNGAYCTAAAAGRPAAVPGRDAGQRGGNGLPAAHPAGRARVAWLTWHLHSPWGPSARRAWGNGGAREGAGGHDVGHGDRGRIAESPNHRRFGRVAEARGAAAASRPGAIRRPPGPVQSP